MVWRAAAATATAAKKPAKKGAACDPMVMEAIRCLDLLVRVASLQQLAAVLSEVLPRAEGEGEEPDDDDPMLTLQPQVSRSCGLGVNSTTHVHCTPEANQLNFSKKPIRHRF